MVKQLPAYVKDTGHILEILEKCRWKNDYLWLSLDVSLLYTYIPHEAGLQALQYFLKGESELPANQIKFIIEMAVFILRHNYFCIMGQFYLQLFGTDMGVSFAPALQIFLWAFGKKGPSGATTHFQSI